LTEFGTASLGGSVNDISPKNYNFFNSLAKLKDSTFLTLNSNPYGNYYFGRAYLAKPRTLSPFLAYLLLTSSYFFLMSSSIKVSFPFIKIVSE